MAVLPQLIVKLMKLFDDLATMIYVYFILFITVNRLQDLARCSVIVLGKVVIMEATIGIINFLDLNVYMTFSYYFQIFIFIYLPYLKKH